MATSTRTSANAAEVTKSQEIVKNYLESIDAANVAANTYSYDCMVALGSAGGGYLNVDFKKNGSRNLPDLREVSPELLVLTSGGARRGSTHR